MQEAMQDIGVSAAEVPTREHGEELASWIMRRCPDVQVQYLQPEGKGPSGSWGVLCFDAPDEDRLWEAVLLWLKRDTGPWPVLMGPETGLARLGRPGLLRRIYNKACTAVWGLRGW